MITSRHFFDQVAIALSAVCLVHCLVLPLLVAAVPLAALSLGAQGHLHTLMLWLVVPTSVAGLGLGFRVHRRAGIVLTGVCAVAILAAAGLWGHSAWDETFETAVSVAGSLLLAAAHWLNFREVRRLHRHG